MKTSSIVLAGGKNLRLGRVKALEIICGQTLIERVVDCLASASSKVIVVTSRELVQLPVGDRAEVLVDIYPEKGPLGGIYTGMMASDTPYSIVVAADMPFLNTGLLRHMVEVAGGYDAVIPSLEEGQTEPLHAVYSRGCLAEMKARLERNELGMQSFVRAIRTRYIGREECRRFDPELLSFFNINYPADLERARALAAAGKC